MAGLPTSDQVHNIPKSVDKLECLILRLAPNNEGNKENQGKKWKGQVHKDNMCDNDNKVVPTTAKYPHWQPSIVKIAASLKLKGTVQPDNDDHNKSQTPKKVHQNP
jgi:hypothetical protein